VINILHALNKRRDEGLARIELADVHLAHADAAAAIDESRRARDILSALSPPDPYNAARASSRLGQAYLPAENLVLARSFLQEAISVLAAQDARQERGRTHRSLAELGRRAGDNDSTQEHNEAADLLLGTDEPADNDVEWP
jgi:hypothetical protein